MLSEIYRVDIEFHSKCNRQCEWCPNKFLDRHSTDEIFDKELFIKLMRDLYDNGFGKKSAYGSNFTQAIISFLGYQEPFLQPELLKEYVNIVKDIFPDRNICLLINSNGDYFSEENLEQLNLSLVNIMDYDCKGKEYWEKRLKENKCAVIESSNNYIVAIHKTVNSVQVFLDWTKNHLLENRGGLLDPSKLDKYQWKNDCAQRTTPCPEPSYYINIYHNGDVTPCCHIRPDAEEHKEFILGNLNEQSIVDIFYGEKASEFRKKASSWKYENFPTPCKNCHKTRDQHFEFIEGLEFPIYRGGYLSTVYNLMDLNYNPLSYIIEKYYDKEDKSNLFTIGENLFNLPIPNTSSSIKEYFKNYYSNLSVIERMYENNYLDLGDSHIARIKTIFDEQTTHQNLNGLIGEYLERDGFYTPFLSFKLFANCRDVNTIIEGRKRFIALQGLALQKTIPPYHSITLHLDVKKEMMKEDFLYCPTAIIDELSLNDNLKDRFYILEKNKEFCKIQSDDELTLFYIIFYFQHLIGKLIDEYLDNFSDWGIYPEASISRARGIAVSID